MQEHDDAADFERSMNDTQDMDSPGEVAMALIRDPKWIFKRMPPDKLYWYDTMRGAYRQVQFGDGLNRQVHRWSMMQSRRRAFMQDVQEIIFTHLDEGEDTLWPLPQFNSVNIKNGLLDLNPRGDVPRLRNHTEEWLTPLQLNVEWDIKNPPPRPVEIEAFLSEVMEPGVLKVFNEMAALLCVPFTYFHKSFVLRGSGGNGKSTAMALLQALLGDDNWTNLSFRNLSGRFGATKLDGKLANFMSETDFSGLQKSDLWKQIIAGDPVMVEEKNQPMRLIRPIARFVMALDDVSGASDTGGGFRRRLIILDFPKTIQDVKTVELGKDELLTTDDELNGYFFYHIVPALRQILATQRLSDVVDEDGKPIVYRDDLDRFYDDMCIAVDDRRIERSIVNRAYKSWCKNEDLQSPPRQRAMNDYLERRGHRKHKIGEWLFEGLEIRE